MISWKSCKMKKGMDQQHIFTNQYYIVEGTEVIWKFGLMSEGRAYLGLNNPEKTTVKV
jgi:hypothetical protein